MKIIVPGRPVPAVRMTQGSKYVDHQAERYLEYKSHVGWIAKKARMTRLTGDVEVIAIAYLFGKREIDADNLAKSMLDSLNGIAYVDDRQVRKLTIEKVKVATKEEQRAEIEVKQFAMRESV
ncbi:RusA family crossover junction endodeoxyribonuclease [Hazenella sp. IB182357]|uniref:RusA family crossover junction endodeoxyribonuclease n=1 Tax=Polycladospora coralii TaxID=2771432 RepID=A0A926RV33_9BACL|nr:RusA family crossover junction endodeoxyribonuclease [Polycladospora coralii]MBD1373738.1 RusA family crossover junction endodeoxyribonuclease [Polycladospora coralii]